MKYEASNLMNADDLREFCRRAGGQSALARLLEWDHSTIWRKLNSKSAITHSDELAIEKVMESIAPPSNAGE